MRKAALYTAGGTLAALTFFGFYRWVVLEQKIHLLCSCVYRRLCSAIFVSWVAMQQDIHSACCVSVCPGALPHCWLCQLSGSVRMRVHSADTVDACRVYRGNVAAREAVAERSVDKKGLSLQDKPVHSLHVQPVRSASTLRLEGD